MQCVRVTMFVLYVGSSEVARVLASGSTRAAVVLRSGLQVDLRVVARESLGAALHYFTGSKAHNIAVRRLAHTQASRIDVLVANGRKGDRGMRYSRLRARVSAAFGVHGSSSAGRQIRDSRPRASPVPPTRRPCAARGRLQQGRSIPTTPARCTLLELPIRTVRTTMRLPITTRTYPRGNPILGGEGPQRPMSGVA